MSPLWKLARRPHEKNVSAAGPGGFLVATASHKCSQKSDHRCPIEIPAKLSDTNRTGCD
jgi:hypothetical protein